MIIQVVNEVSNEDLVDQAENKHRDSSFTPHILMAKEIKKTKLFEVILCFIHKIISHFSMTFMGV